MLLRALNVLFNMVQTTKICKFNGITNRNIHNELDYFSRSKTRWHYHLLPNLGESVI